MNLLFSCIGKRGYIADYFRRALGPGVTIIGTSSTPWTPGFTSCDRACVLPPYRCDDYKPAVLDLIRDNKVDGIISLMDEDVAVLASIQEQIRELNCRPMLPPLRIAELCLDKWEAFNFFTAHNFRTPQTYNRLSACIDGLRDGKVSLPLFVKPRYGFGSSNSFVAKTISELEVLFNYAPGMIAQELIAAKWYNADVLCDLKGTAISIVPWRKLSSRVGETEQAVTVEHPQVLSFVRRLLDALGEHVGPMDIDLYATNGEVGVLEMNPRFGGGYPVTHHAGGDFPSLIGCMLRGEEVPPRIGAYRRDVIMMKNIVPFGGENISVSRHLLKLETKLPDDGA